MKIHYSPLWVCLIMETQQDQQELELLASTLAMPLKFTTMGRGLAFVLPAEKQKAITAFTTLFKRPETSRYYMERVGLLPRSTFVLHINADIN